MFVPGSAHGERAIVMVDLLAETAPSSHRHGVLIFGTADDLAVQVANFVGNSLAGSGNVLVVAQAELRPALDAVLAAPESVRALASGRLLVVSAEQTLARILRDGLPDADLFDDVVGGLVRRHVPVTGVLRIYGDMVADLWGRGEVEAALQLEDLWNRLMREVPCELLCAYPLAIVDDPADGQLERLIAGHSSVRVESAGERLHAVY